MNDLITDYPEKSSTTLTYFNQSIYKTKVAWINWALLFGTFILLAIFSKNDEYDGVAFPFILVFLFLSTWFSIGGFKDGIKSLLKKEDVGNLRIGLIIANFSIFGPITIGLAVFIIRNVIYYYF